MRRFLRELAEDIADDIRPRLRHVPAAALIGAAFITWGLRLVLAGLSTILEIAASW